MSCRKNEEHASWLSNILKMSSTYRKYNLGLDAWSLFISLVSKLAMKKLDRVGPSGDPIVTPLICWYGSSLYKNNPWVALNISFTKMSLLNGGQLGLSLAYT